MTDVITSAAEAAAADAADPLAEHRAKFALRAGLVYLDGNSLGAMPVDAPALIDDAARRQWGQDLIESWNANGWWDAPVRIGDRIGRLIGAKAGQVICGDSTSIQLFQALSGALRLNPDRRVLLTDGGNFPTDQYIADSVGRLLGVEVRRISPADAVTALGSGSRSGIGEIAAVSFSAVDYRTGELWDVEAITAAAHAHGAAVVWDLAHAAGALPVHLDDLDAGAGADFAVGCSYKYLNGGPGAPAWLYINARHQATADLPLTGWQGHAEPFALHQHYAPAEGIARGRIGTPPLLSMLALDAALDIFDAADLEQVRAKSLALTDLVLRYAADHLADLGVVAATPAEHHRRGSQVALRLPRAYEAAQALIEAGVVGDFRAPDILRLGFAPLYLTHAQVWGAMETLETILRTGAHLDPRFAIRAAVT
ncbi:MAG: kynU [Pseudonocardiales bacterium]|nr:kynU [Pseudonocardiales bacterium]